MTAHILITAAIATGALVLLGLVALDVLLVGMRGVSDEEMQR